MKLLQAVAVLAWILPASLPAATWVVRPDGTGDFPTIQAAVDASAAGDVITLTDGTFSGAGNRAVRYLGKEITIRSVNGAAAVTISCGGNAGFMFVDHETASSRLEDVTITQASTALLLNVGSPVITGCVITASGTGIDSGALLSEPQPSNPEASFITITGCGSGAVTREAGRLRLTNSTVSGCGSTVVGVGGTITATDCLFTSNGGGAYWTTGYPGSGGTFTRCTFANTDNPAINTGGSQDVSLVDCTFTNNSPAVYCHPYPPSIVGCAFINNSGAIRAELSNQGTLTITNSIFCDNTAGDGGAIYSLMPLTVSGCTFVDNSATSDGGAIYTEASLHVTGCTFVGNHGYGAALHSYASGVVEQSLIAFSTGGGRTVSCAAGLIFSCNDIYGNADGDAVCGTDGGNNFSLDPLLCAPAGCDEVGISSLSPCAPANNACGVQIGAGGVECPVTAATPLAAFELAQNTPNPFNPQTRIAFTLPEASVVELAVFDVGGRLVATLVRGSRPAGPTTVDWNGTDAQGNAVGSGVYFCRLKANGEQRTIKMVLMK